MAQLPFASSDTCRACGADAKPERYRFSLVGSVARESLHTGNLCEQCYEEVLAVIEHRPPASSPDE